MNINKEFQKNDLDIMQELIGKEVKNIIFQPTKGLISVDNMFIINFGKKLEYSLHIFCFIRIRDGNHIILTSSDEFVGLDYQLLKNINNQDNNQKCLLNSNLNKAKKIIKSAIINSVIVNEIADIVIQFNNGIIIEIINDCLINDYELYRFFKPNNKNPHYIVQNNKGKIFFLLE